jgi:hypothetical protein
MVNKNKKKLTKIKDRYNGYLVWAYDEDTATCFTTSIR